MIGIREFILPFTAGAGGTAYAQPSLENIYLEGARAQGGLAGFMHPYTSAPKHARQCRVDAHRARRRPRPRRLLRHRRALFRRARVGGLLLPPAQRRLPHSRDRRHRQLLRRLDRSAAGLVAHVCAHLRARSRSPAGWTPSSAAGRTSPSGPLVRFEVEGQGPGEETRPHRRRSRHGARRRRRRFHCAARRARDHRQRRRRADRARRPIRCT